MVSRRKVVVGASELVGGGAILIPTLSMHRSSTIEQDSARALRRRMQVDSGERSQQMRELIRYATLAPSSHNTQCWRFRIKAKSITITPDYASRCPAVDPDDHHLFVSLGCATENLVQAALAAGLKADPRFDASETGQIAVHLDATKCYESPLFQAIPARQCTRGDYDGLAIAPAELRLLEKAGTGVGVSMRLLTARPAIEGVLEYVIAGNTAQMADAAFVEELKAWIRFSASEAQRTGDGLFAGASGNPALPRWLGSRMMGLFFTAKSENDRYTRQIRNCAGIAVLLLSAATGRTGSKLAVATSALRCRPPR